MERAEVVRHLMRNIKKHGFPFEKLTTVTFSLNADGWSRRRLFLNLTRIIKMEQEEFN